MAISHVLFYFLEDEPENEEDSKKEETQKGNSINEEVGLFKLGGF